MSDKPKAVYAAITNVMADVAIEGIAKNQTNEGQKYKFRGIDSIYNCLAPILSKHKLMMLPRIFNRTEEERKTNNGGRMAYVVVECEFDLVSAEDGSIHTIRTIGEAMDSADKATNKAMSAAYKYAAMMAFCIPTEGDNDADQTTHEVAVRSSPKQSSPDNPDRIRAIEILEGARCGSDDDFNKAVTAFLSAGLPNGFADLDEIPSAHWKNRRDALEAWSSGNKKITVLDNHLSFAAQAP